jgi:hypothetical protein
LALASIAEKIDLSSASIIFSRDRLRFISNFGTGGPADCWIDELQQQLVVQSLGAYRPVM